MLEIAQQHGERGSVPLGAARRSAGFTGERSYHNTAASTGLLCVARKKRERKKNDEGEEVEVEEVAAFEGAGKKEKTEEMIQLKLYIIWLSSVSACVPPALLAGGSSSAGRPAAVAVITPPPLTTCMIVSLTPHHFVSVFQRARYF